MNLEYTARNEIFLQKILLSLAIKMMANTYWINNTSTFFQVKGYSIPALPEETRPSR